MRMTKVLFLPLMMTILAGCGGGGGGGGTTADAPVVQSAGAVTGNGSETGIVAAAPETAQPSGSPPAPVPAGDTAAQPSQPASQPATQPAAVSKTVSLAWNASVGANGQPDPLVSGYRIYYGNRSGQYSKVVTLGKVTTTALSGLGAGNYYFALTAFDAQGNESVYSDEISTTI